MILAWMALAALCSGLERHIACSISCRDVNCMGDVRFKKCIWHTKQEHLSFVYKRNGITHVQNLNLIFVITENVLKFCTMLMNTQQVHLITSFSFKKWRRVLREVKLWSSQDHTEEKNKTQSRVTTIYQGVKHRF